MHIIIGMYCTLTNITNVVSLGVSQYGNETGNEECIIYD